MGKWWNKVWGVVKKVVNKVVNILPLPAWAKGAILGSILIIDGIAYIVKLINGLKQLEKKALLGTITIISSQSCNKDAFDDSQLVLQETGHILYLFAAGHLKLTDPDVQEACEIMKYCYEYSESYIKSCIKSEDDMYVDTGHLIHRSFEMIQHFCSDEGYADKLMDNSTCGFKGKAECVEKNKKELQSNQLDVADELERYAKLTQDEAEQYLRKKGEIGKPEGICSEIEKIITCAAKVNKGIVCQHNVDEELENKLNNEFGQFCGKHKKHFAAAGSDKETAATTGKSGSGAGIPLLMTILPYLQILASRTI